MDPPMNYLEFIFGTRWAHYDLYSWMQSEDTSVEFKIRKVLENGQPLFPELMSLEYIESLRQRKGELFYLNYMNEVTGGAVNAFDLSRLRFYNLEKDGSIAFDVLPPETFDMPEPMPPEPEAAPIKPKRFWQTTPQERVERWNRKHEDWRRERAMRHVAD